jgi:uncharacterized protein (TIGR04222 family)
MVSPFDLRGPEFLLFYLVLGTCVLAALYCLRYAGASDPPQVNLSDPYLIAFLRGGQNEALRVATISLIDRGLLETSGTRVASARDKSAAELRVPIEKRLFAHFETPADVASLFEPGVCGNEITAYESELTRLDLIPGEDSGWLLNAPRMLATALLWGVALVKILVALARGRSNIGFLIILATAFGVAAWRLGRPRITRRGIAMLSSLRKLFSGLKDRAPLLRPSETADEVLLLAAVFGVGAVPGTVFPVRTLFPRASSFPTSSCGSACGSSCGGGCGGGGCGGGCGGCGS